jgi:hypothetical protein
VTESDSMRSSGVALGVLFIYAATGSVDDGHVPVIDAWSRQPQVEVKITRRPSRLLS